MPSATTSVTSGSPLVSVPVLSITTVSMRAAVSECDGVLEQHAAAGAEAGADHDRGRRRQAEGIGAGDDHHGDGEQHRVGDGPAGEHAPDEERDAAADEGDEHQPERGPVSQALAGRLGVLRFLDQLHDLRKRSVGTDLGRTGPHRAGRVQRGADQQIAGRLVHREALARDHRLVEIAVAFDHLGVDRHLGARADQQQVTDHDLRGRHLDRFAVAQHDRHRRGEVEEGADRVVGATAHASRTSGPTARTPSAP